MDTQQLEKVIWWQRIAIILLCLPSVISFAERIYTYFTKKVGNTTVLYNRMCSCSPDQSVNTLGSIFTIDPKTAVYKDLGKVTSTQVEIVTLPAKVGAQSLFKFTRKDGKTVHMGLEMKPVPAPGADFPILHTKGGKKLTAGKDYHIIEIYRYNDAKNDWSREGIIFVKTGVDPVSFPITINP